MILRSLLALSAVLFMNASYAADAKQTKTSRPTSAQAFSEAEKMLGTVPTMLKLIPDSAVPGAWQAMKGFQLGQTELSGKTKELIGLAVAAQIPCRYCLYFHSKAAIELNQATENDTKEAIAIAALTRHWSAIYDGLNQDDGTFNKELDRMFRAPMRQSRTESATGTESGATSAPSKAARSMPVAETADDVYREAKKMWGFVPTFISKHPKSALAGVWNEFNGIMMNPDSTLTEKDRSLIALAVSAQIPSRYGVAMNKRSAKMSGASDEEINEALVMAATTRHWSTVLNGNMIDEKAFRSETDGMMAFVKKAKDGSTSGTSTSVEDDEAQ